MTLKEYSTSVAEQFLQTAVFVDDKIFHEDRVHVKSVTHDVATKVRQPSRKSVKKAEASELVLPNQPARGLRCQDIVESFAKKRIVCSLYQLGRSSGAGPQSNLYKLVVSADILIIDWDIEGDRGEKASQLVASLVRSSLENEPEQLRSIIVYTAEANLKVSVADKLYEKLSEEVAEEFEIELKKEDKGLAFHTKNSRITILGKPITVGRLEEFLAFEVLETALADRAILEFSKLANGLLQGAALHGLAIIRKNTRRIITRFGSELDGPFLVHRALSLPNEEAIDHLVPLLVAEIESVLEDQVERTISDSEILDDWCDQSAKTGAFAKEKLSKAEDLNTAAKKLTSIGPAFQEFLQSKSATLSSKYIKGGQDLGDYRWDIRSGNHVEDIGSFLMEDESAKLGYGSLAALMSQRTFYTTRRELSLGSIVFDGKNHYLCIQPACDCVRLEGWCPFPLLKLENSTKRFDIVLVDQADVISLQTDFKPSSISLVYFRAGTTSGVVEAKQIDDGWVFKGGASIKGPKKKYSWIAQLKTEQALRCVTKITSQLGRVGLTESVWARLMSK